MWRELPMIFGRTLKGLQTEQPISCGLFILTGKIKDMFKISQFYEQQIREIDKISFIHGLYV